jgi:hypothetical protein
MRDQLIRRHLAQRRNLYAKAVLAGDLRTALACVQDEAKLEGLYPSERKPDDGRGVVAFVPITFIEVNSSANPTLDRGEDQTGWIEGPVLQLPSRPEEGVEE